ncbi:MAG: tetratricopeptide repeat protein [Deltaproteobacteria bacterium]|nr:tetratricopeptide repeat protein [Deltaproteobacteria bacterium]
MSYINEALKKAQREKDALAAKYSGFLAARRKKGKGLRGRPFLWSTLIVALIMLAFVLHSWLDSRGTETTSASKGVSPRDASKKEVLLDGKDLYERARRLQKSGRSREARRLYLKALTLDPQNVQAVNNIGVTFLQERNFIEARKRFEDAVRLQPDYVDPHYNLACLYAIQGDTKRGLDYLKRAVSLDASVRQWARNDDDLWGLRALPEFEEVVKER